ncbi:DUF6745 domain-containing protein [Spirillospora sp. NPDC047279]|uniref:DUF6745 domain-containing protein n=1 Tax=Spirillospora sp. NPDC047279 TaxID=3155478 RepID=UPI0033E05C79
MTSEESGGARRLDELCHEWRARAADPPRGEAERALAELYELRGWGRPKAVIWLESPLAGAIAARTLLYGHEHLDRARHPEAHERWVDATKARLEGTYGTFDRHEPNEWEEDQDLAPRWRVPDVHSLYKRSYDMTDPNVQAVLRQVGEPGWAINTGVSARFQQEALGPSDPAFFAEVGAQAHERLAEGLRPVFPAEQQEAVLAAVRSCGDAPRPDHWKQWRDVWAAVRAPENQAALLLAASQNGDSPQLGALLRAAPAVGWWWALNDIVLATPPPAEVHTDSWGRLHREDGPAVVYADGFAQHCWRGHLVPADLITPGWSAADIVHASDEELRERAVLQLGPSSYAAALKAEHVVPDLRRCALERLGWPRLAAEAPLARVAGPVADPGDPGCELTLHDVPPVVFGRAARVAVRSGGARDGSVVLVPTDATDPVTAAAWLGDGASEPPPAPELLTRIQESEELQDVLAGLDWEMSHVSHFEHVEEVHLRSGAQLYSLGGHGTGGTYFLCGDGPSRPLVYAGSEGSYQVLGRDLTEGLRFMISADPDGGDPEEEAAEAAEALGLRPLTPEEYRSSRRRCETLAAALTLVQTDEGNAYTYDPSSWFRC